VKGHSACQSLSNCTTKAKLFVNIGNVFCTDFFSVNFHCCFNNFLYASTRIMCSYLYSNYSMNLYLLEYGKDITIYILYSR